MKKKIVFLPYDFDTAIGINNEGGLTFSYNLEDIDQTESGADIFNGQQSVLWKNMRAAFFEEMRTMYQNLRSTGALSYEKVEQMFEEHQAKWPEAVFNEDAWFKYLAPLVEKGNGSYLSMLQGSKAEQRKWWLYNRFRYIDSKYNAGDSLSDVITVRGYAKSDISVTPYADIYATIKYGSYLVQTRAARNNTYILACPLDNVNDTEIYIYSASQLSDVGDLSGLMVGYADFSKAVRLQNLKIGDSDPQYSNGNLKELYLGNNELLREIDIRNCPSLTQSVDISGCSNIERVYFDGTGITGLSLPNGGILKTLHLPGSMVNLTLLNQTALTDFVLPSADNLTTLRLENVSSAVDSMTMLRGMPANSRVRVLGFNWELSSYTAVDTLYSYLDTMRGTDENGGNTEKPQLSGNIHVPALTTDQERALRARYADIHLDADAWTYRVRYFHNGELLHTAYVEEGKDAPEPVTTGDILTPEKPAEGNIAYAFSGWDKPLTDISQDLDVTAAFEGHRAFLVTFQDYNGTVLLVKKVAEGTTCPDPVKTGEISAPKRPGDSTHVYTYLGWTGGSLINVTSDRTLIAAYSEETSYTISFVNYDNSELLTLYLPKNAPIPNPILTGMISQPIRERDDNYVYTFNNWSNAGSDGLTFGTVSSNKTFTARYNSKAYYRCTFKNWDGTVLLEEIYYYADYVTDPVTAGRLEEPVKESDGGINYFFWKWSRAFPYTISSHTVVTAVYHTDVIHTVTFVQDDGTTVLDTQMVMDGSDALDPITSGRIATPLKSSTAQYDYTFSKWNTTFTAITADKSVRAVYASAVRSYYVTYFDDSTQMAQIQVKYNDAPEYPGWPMKPNDENGLHYLSLWTPEVYSVQSALSLYATWKTANITDTWEEIFAAEHDGTYKTKYNIGDIKMLDMGADGIIPMQIIGFDKDDLADGSGKAPITWLAAAAPESTMRWTYPEVTYSTYSETKRTFMDGTDENGTYYYASLVSSRYQARREFTLTANEDSSFTMYVTASLQYNGNVCYIFENDVPIERMAAIGTQTRELTYDLKKHESIRLIVLYRLESAGTSGNLATVRFSTNGDIDISYQDLEPIRNTNYGVKSWANTRFRQYLHENLLQKIPTVVRSTIKPVIKYSATAENPDPESDYVITHDTLWIPSKTELNPLSSYSNYVLPYGPVYDYFQQSSRDDAQRLFTRKGQYNYYDLRDMKNNNGHIYCARSDPQKIVNSFNQDSTYSGIRLGFCT